MTSTNPQKPLEDPREEVLGALVGVIVPGAEHNVVSAGMISGVAVREGSQVGFILTLSPQQKAIHAALQKQCEDAVAALPWVEKVTVVVTAHSAEPIPPSPSSGYKEPRERAVWNLSPVEGVKQVIIVASGKGGVGKSTTAVNLARALAERGLKAGLLDADIYGPSLPRMLGLMEHGKPEIEDGKMIPPESGGIPCMSIGFITGDQAAVLRGPMISKSLHQLLRGTRWAKPDTSLDVLIIDLPPGTGDVQLSLAQQVPIFGAVIVTTPQQVAVMDAAKALAMFGKVDVKVLGVVENMCGEVFGHGGGRELAEKAGVPLLGEIPLVTEIREAADSGENFLQGKSDAAKIYDEIAEKLAAELADA